VGHAWGEERAGAVRPLRLPPDRICNRVSHRPELQRAAACTQVWDLKDLGLQAAQRVLEASDPLRLLTELAQNFPTHAGPLSRLDVSADLRKELAANRRVMQAGPNRFNSVVCLNESE